MYRWSLRRLRILSDCLEIGSQSPGSGVSRFNWRLLRRIRIGVTGLALDVTKPGCSIRNVLGRRVVV